MMQAIKIVWRFEAISMLRNIFQMILMACVLLLGLYAIYYGNSIIHGQRRTIEMVRHIEQEEFNGYQKSLEGTLSSTKEEQTFQIATNPAYAWHRHGYHAILPPHGYAGLALGQRDVEPYYHKITGMGLYYQLFEGELANPIKLYAGNFDLSFVLIYLFPLLIIAFTYGLYAEEKENGILPLLNIQPISLNKIIFIRLGFYFLLILGLGFLLSLIGFMTSENGFDWRATSLWLATVLTYLGFWFALMYFLVSLKQNSSLTAICASALWLFFLIVFPAILNSYATAFYPIDSTVLAEITRRKSLANEEDLGKAKEIVLEYLATQEGLKGANLLLDQNTMSKAYAAFTALNDAHYKGMATEYLKQIRQRDQWVSHFKWINPAVNAQGAFNEVVQTDLGTFQSFHRSIESFHKAITHFYFSRLFLDKSITAQDYGALPKFHLLMDREANVDGIWKCLLEIVVITMITLVGGWALLKK